MLFTVHWAKDLYQVMLEALASVGSAYMVQLCRGRLLLHRTEHLLTSMVEKPIHYFVFGMELAT